MKIRLLIAVVSAVALVAAGCSSAGDDAQDVLNDYVATYNGGDIDAVMALFTEESIIVGHPFAVEAKGLTAIRSLHITDMAAAATESAYSISNVSVTGNTVTWDHTWTNSSGQTFCQRGQTAEVEEGKIVSWTWPDDDFGCS